MYRLIGAAAMAVLLSCAAPAVAQERANPGDANGNPANSTTVAVGLICDTPQQVERYLALYKDGASAETAMNVVNREVSNPKACGIAVAAFVVGQPLGTLNVPGGTAQIVEITIVAAHTGKQWRTTSPTKQYTAVFLEGQET